MCINSKMKNFYSRAMCILGFISIFHTVPQRFSVNAVHKLLLCQRGETFFWYFISICVRRQFLVSAQDCVWRQKAKDARHTKQNWMKRISVNDSNESRTAHSLLSVCVRVCVLRNEKAHTAKENIITSTLADMNVCIGNFHVKQSYNVKRTKRYHRPSWSVVVICRNHFITYWIWSSNSSSSRGSW